ncbi:MULTISPECIES: single-stranded DNA-binding protein [unclassified Leifsonia]|uniref:single-stranded DNA-binding protein n=1 Tax=unclassified Leifsonia TaxID=2663824 RepID=UPI000AD150B5|nr:MULTISPECIES: single-stranded DNA-binding protein [unclassified Leifsonia]
MNSYTNSITIVGNVGTEPTATILPGGARKVTFRVAASERYFDRKKSEWVEADPSWFTVEAFRALGEHVEQSVHRGENVVVTGRLRVRTWETEKGRGTAVDLEADAIGHNLAWGTSAYSKAARPESSVASGQQGAHATPDGVTGGVEAERTPGWGTPMTASTESQALATAGVEDTPF